MSDRSAANHLWVRHLGYRSHSWHESDGMLLCCTCDAFAIAACWDTARLDGLCGRGLTYEASGLPDYAKIAKRFIGGLCNGELETVG